MVINNDIGGEAQAEIRVLLVDDQAMICETIRRMFATEIDIEFRYCTDATKAMQIVKEFKPTVILQDLVMPNTDGMELLAQYKKDPITKKIPILMLSSKDEVETKSLAFLNGASDYLIKIPELIELLARIRHHSKTYTNEIARDDARREVLEVIHKNELISKSRAEFIDKMSHVLHDKVNTILQCGKQLAHDDHITKVELSHVTGILKTSHHILRLINQVQDMFNIDAGQLDLSLEPIELVPLLDECMKDIRTLATNSNITVTCNPLAGAMVWADRVYLKRALLSLLANAIKFNNKGGSVKVDVQANGEGKLRINVVDTGRGIAYEKITDLFKPFNRLGIDDGDVEGVGIDLALAKSIIETMGGKVGVTSKVGEGSKFWIELAQESIYYM